MSMTNEEIIAELKKKRKEFVDKLANGDKEFLRPADEFNADIDKIDDDLMSEALDKARAEGMNIPEKCANCGDKLNKWVGSHTCVRIQSPKMVGDVLTFAVKYICTDCFWNMFTRKEHDEIIRKFIQEDKKQQSARKELDGLKAENEKLKATICVQQTELDSAELDWNNELKRADDAEEELKQKLAEKQEQVRKLKDRLAYYHNWSADELNGLDEIFSDCVEKEKDKA